jgi:hypothetical protein
MHVMMIWKEMIRLLKFRLDTSKRLDPKASSPDILAQLCIAPTPFYIVFIFEGMLYPLILLWKASVIVCCTEMKLWVGNLNHVVNEIGGKAMSRLSHALTT